MPRVSEDDIAIALMKIAVERPNGLVTYKRAYSEIPNHVALSEADRAQSTTRPNEEMWQQLVRNIRSHHESDGNFINRGLLEHVKGSGYKITVQGRNFLSNI